MGRSYYLFALLITLGAFLVGLIHIVLININKGFIKILSLGFPKENKFCIVFSLHMSVVA